MKVCPKCAHANADEAAQCAHCASPLADVAPSPYGEQLAAVIAHGAGLASLPRFAARLAKDRPDLVASGVR
jgi:hypothetical protein